MATIRKRKSGTYEIKVSCGYDINGKQVIQYKHWKPEDGMTKKQIEKEVNRQAVLFEEECKKGQITASIKFQNFACIYRTDCPLCTVLLPTRSATAHGCAQYT